MVIGASSGLGLAIAERLAREYHVTELSRRSVSARPFYPCDVTSDESVESALTQATHDWSVPELVVYSAGYAAMGITTAIPPSEARTVFETNFWGLDRVVRTLASQTRPNTRTCVVAILSIAALRAVPHEAYYAASKAAAARYLECMRHELGPLGIDLKFLAPGYIETGFLQRSPWYGMSPPVVRGSGVSPEDVADAVVRLAKAEGTKAVLGWRERAIVLADRVAPTLYDRLLQRRSARAR